MTYLKLLFDPLGLVEFEAIITFVDYSKVIFYSKEFSKTY